jgi:hypothetical protein
MPLYRDYTFHGGRKVTSVTPEFEQEWRQMCMELNAAPNWRNDPTYDLATRKDRRCSKPKP